MSEDVKAALEEAEAELASVYRRLWPLREAYAEAFPPADMPSRRQRTDKQRLVERCPRCGGRLEESDDAKAIRANREKAESGYLGSSLESEGAAPK